ncbi:hypothetical protein F4809DRAFT_621808 [Biscogniauxia mediterranea]|nr:hypothetical protein F4809DRAFT_621808 [Biscogniauxia mediterranea]
MLMQEARLGILTSIGPKGHEVLLITAIQCSFGFWCEIFFFIHTWNSGCLVSISWNLALPFVISLTATIWAYSHVIILNYLVV